MSSKTIPLFRACAGKEELRNVKKVLDSGFLGKWKFTEQFEKKFAKFTGAKYCVGTNSGTAALHLALMAYGIGRGDEVLVPNLTFCSTALVVLYVGARPVWVDVDPETLCMDPEDMVRKITTRTAAVIPVHYGGSPADMKNIFTLFRLHAPEAVIIEDAAQAFAAKYPSGWRVGCCCGSDVTCFSLEAKKILTCGQGGAVTTNNSDIAKKVRILAWLGIDKGTGERMTGGYNWRYDVVDINGHLGYKYHMSDIEAAIMLAQLKKVDRIIAARRKIVARYDAAFKDVPWIKILKRSAGSACWNYAMILQDDTSMVEHGIIGVAPDREKFIEYMTKCGISIGVHYQLLNQLTAFKKFARVDTPNADKLWDRIVVLPVFVGLTERKQDYIIKCVREFWRAKK